VANAAGIDLSSYQPSFDWSAEKGRISFAFIKATEGITIRDPSFAANWQRARDIGIVRGAYHFAHPRNGAATEARAFLDTVRAHGLNAGDLLALDLEVSDGLGPAPFGTRVAVTDTHIGGFDFIPPQPDRSVDAEPGLAWDRTTGRHAGRVYLVYTIENKNESDDTNVEVRFSDDNGATWSDPTRVNTDTTRNSQFLPKIGLDPTSGQIGVIWYDARNDLGRGGSGDTDGVANTDAQVWGAFSRDGKTFTPNLRISAGTSNAPDSGNGIDYGDYSGVAIYGGVLHPAWSDNSNSDGLNPDGTLHKLDIFSARVSAP